MNVDIAVDMDGLPGSFALAGAASSTLLQKTVYRTGAMLRTLVRAGASGRPGPRVQTGDYRRSIAQVNGMDRGVPTSLVSTNSPQAYRLEYGFNDVDVLGRRFHQPPLPHWRPAIPKAEAFFLDEVSRATTAAVDTALSRTAARWLRRVL